MYENLLIENCRIMVDYEEISSINFDERHRKISTCENRLLELSNDLDSPIYLDVEYIAPVAITWKQEVIFLLEDKLGKRFDNDIRDWIEDCYLCWAFDEIAYRYFNANYGIYESLETNIHKESELTQLNNKLNNIDKNAFIAQYYNELKEYDPNLWNELLNY